jgi:hypothetical protein
MELRGSNVLRFEMADGTSVIVRPSGTEPKIKVYLLTRGADRGRLRRQHGKIRPLGGLAGRPASSRLIASSSGAHSSRKSSSLSIRSSPLLPRALMIPRLAGESAPFFPSSAPPQTQ